MKTLIIAEKPSVATDICRALGKLPKNGDFYENDQYVVSSAVGHLVELAMPEDYDKKLGFWRLADLPIVPDSFELKPIEKTKKRFQELKRLLNRKDVGDVINACDAGREGELIFNYTYKLSKSKKPVRRLWMSSMTSAGIREAFEHLRSDKQMRHLADAARCRSEADWLIGINCTRGATKRMFGSRAGNVAGVGRVQTPTLAIVHEREKQIRAFIPRTYFRVVAEFGLKAGSYEGVLQRADFKRGGTDDQDRIDRIWTRAQAEAVATALGNATHARVQDEKKRTTQAAPRLYDLTTLQREANNRFGYPARRTLQIAQALYERHKMITYPRTDSKALPEDYIPVCREVLNAMQGDLAPHARLVLENGWVRPNKRVFDNAQVSDHFAIIPTPEKPKKLGEEEARIFDLIARRFIAIFHPSAQFDVTTRLTQVESHAFKTEGKILVEPGYLAVYGRELNDENGHLPPVSPADGDPARALIRNHRIDEEATRPPPRYTEATLLSAMEGAGKLVDDDDLADAMKEKGLGTPATRAQVIERLINEKYMDRDRRDLVPTDKADRLFSFLTSIEAEALTRPDLTGEWEFKLRKIEHGELDGDTFIAEIAKLTRELIERIKAPQPDSLTDIICPTDGKPMLENFNRYISQDEKLTVYKTVGGRNIDPEEVRELVGKCRTDEIGEDEIRSTIGPLKFRSKRGTDYFARLTITSEYKVKMALDRREGDEGGIAVGPDAEPVGTCPITGGDIFELTSAFVVRVKKDGEDTFPYKLSRQILSKELTLENFMTMLRNGKTDLIKGFISNRTKRPFDAFLVLKEGGRSSFEFPPRAPKKPGKAGGARKKATVQTADAAEE
ncbi:MAG: DNA topoisomerase 3 [Opitutaceae bacterium]